MRDTHWTERSADDYAYRLGSDFVRQVKNALQSAGLNQSALAEKIGVSNARVSQIISSPSNMTLRTMVKCVRALGLKVAVVVYDDCDKPNEHGPVCAEVFASCWESEGKPRDFFDTDRRDV